ncbi:hypothetical protein EVAR_39909_1 [Eumeta japonica]|uniref:Uncharacterized protein n=1 Tax=Eumeta variegata TaxID=151549 RepID=A0A4C1WNL7_EUMVA|nr:hypothetical protein EVAR_39909_1 [Eumeta japonica]
MTCEFCQIVSPPPNKRPFTQRQPSVVAVREHFFPSGCRFYTSDVACQLALRLTVSVNSASTTTKREHVFLSSPIKNFHASNNERGRARSGASCGFGAPRHAGRARSSHPRVQLLKVMAHCLNSSGGRP